MHPRDAPLAASLGISPFLIRSSNSLDVAPPTRLLAFDLATFHHSGTPLKAGA
jgi:hypothetical protein